MARKGTEPVKRETGLFQRWKRAFQAAFSDGYQAGDILKALIAPLSDANKETDFSYLTGGNGLLNNLTGALSSSNQSILGEVQSIQDQSRQEFLEDREHTEEREDTAYQRQVLDMRRAGLNPYTINASPVSPSPSTVGQNTLTSKLQSLGYILELRNLDNENKKIVNSYLGTILKALRS